MNTEQFNSNIEKTVDYLNTQMVGWEVNASQGYALVEGKKVSPVIKGVSKEGGARFVLCSYKDEDRIFISTDGITVTGKISGFFACWVIGAFLGVFLGIFAIIGATAALSFLFVLPTRKTDPEELRTEIEVLLKNN